jgi:predicted restriction endonuclease
MDAKEAYSRRRDFFGKQCNHPYIEKEYEQGVDIYEYVCAVCGSEFVKKEIWEQIHRAQEQQKDYH